MQKEMLSLKYRPFSWEEIAGQDNIVQEFKNRSKELKGFPQVNIFEGPSGTGKTSLACLVAATISCSNPIHASGGELTPCSKCESCNSIRNERFNRDVSFFDASTMGKDDVLSLEELVSMAPLYDKAKVIIIDEAQALTKAAKGATLKLLEKKRKDVYFILCTMDENAFDKSIKSRAQTFKFKPLSVEAISRLLFHIVVKEEKNFSIPVEFSEVLPYIADKAQGNMREAIQLLERALYGEYFTLEQIEEEFNVISQETGLRLLNLLINYSPEFFQELAKKDAQEFFYYAWKVLTDWNVFLCTGYIDQKWKVKSIEGIPEREDSVKQLAQLHTTLFYSIPYWNTNAYLTEIANYYNSRYPSLTKLPQRKPISG